MDDSHKHKNEQKKSDPKRAYYIVPFIRSTQEEILVYVVGRQEIVITLGIGEGSPVTEGPDKVLIMHGFLM